MDDLISRKALLEKFKRIGLGENSFIERVFADGVFVVIENAHTIDAVPVVRCKDCQNAVDIEKDYLICTLWGCGTDFDGFCYKGEWRDSDIGNGVA